MIYRMHIALSLFNNSDNDHDDELMMMIIIKKMVLLSVPSISATQRPADCCITVLILGNDRVLIVIIIFRGNSIRIRKIHKSGDNKGKLLMRSALAI